MTRKVHIYPPPPTNEDLRGDGGVRRVVESQVRHLEQFGWEYTTDPAEADVIACHIEIPPTYLRQFPRTPMVLHNHGLYWTEYEWERSLLHYNAKIVRAMRAVNVITAVSDWTATAIRRNTMRDVRVVHHGIDADDWTPRAGLDYVLWNKTRADPVCDPEPLVQVARLMPDVKFVTTILPEDVTVAPPNVTVTGVVGHEEAKDVVADAGVYLATTRETFGIGTLEALAAGVPIVGWAWGGQTEIITQGVDGWLATPGDIEGLADGIRWALGSREARIKAREKAEAFPAAASVGKYAAIYDELADAHEERAGAPAVSVVVPAYGLDRFLADTLESVLAQTSGDWECIVVDDASPDRCGEIADAYAERDPRFRVIHNETNQYLSGARNTGIAAALGRYIFPLDADDLIDPRTLETLAGELDLDRELDIAYGNVRFVEEDGVTPTDYRVRGQTPGHSGWPMEWNLDRQLDGPGQLLPYASMYRREVWNLTAGYRERCRSSEDCDFWLRTTSYGFTPRYVTQADTLVYRNRPDSMSRDVGWRDAQHRQWYPWVGDRAILPAAGRSTPEVRFPSFDPPQISVVIPVGPGHASLLIDAVDSVDAQTFRGWECIVVNDTGEPLPNLPSWVRVVEPRADRFNGVAAARNAGVMAAKARLFLPLDADDYLQPRALEIMFDAHMESDDRPVVYSDFWEDPHVAGEWVVWNTPDSDPAGLITHGLRYAVTCLTPVEYWREVGGYDEDLPAWEDWAFQLKLAAKGRCTRRVALPLFNYRKHTGFRRNDNMAGFDDAKTAMMRKDFGYTGGELLACSSCPGGAKTTARGGPIAGGAASMPSSMIAAQDVSGEAVPVEYFGKKTGAVSYRGPSSGQVYRFAAGGRDAVKLVLREDLEHFTMRPDFRVVTQEAIAAQPPIPGASLDDQGVATPAMVAEGPPSGNGGAPPSAAPPGPGMTSEDIAEQQAAAAAAESQQPDPQKPAEASAEGSDTPQWTLKELQRKTRTEVNDIATKVGVDGPGDKAKYPNKDTVIGAMRMRGALKEEPEPAAV